MQMMLAGVLFLVFADSLLVPSTHRTPSRERSRRSNSPTGRSGRPSSPTGRSSRSSSSRGRHGASTSPRRHLAGVETLDKEEGELNDVGNEKIANYNKELDTKAFVKAKVLELARKAVARPFVPEFETLTERGYDEESGMPIVVYKYKFPNGTVVDKRPGDTYTTADLGKKLRQADLKKKKLVEAVANKTRNLKNNAGDEVTDINKKIFRAGEINADDEAPISSS